MQSSPTPASKQRLALMNRRYIFKWITGVRIISQVKGKVESVFFSGTGSYATLNLLTWGTGFTWTCTGAL